MTNPQTHLFWITSRAAGITALLLASLSVGFGLLMGGKLMKRIGPDRRTIHEVLSLSVIVAIAVHGLALIGDNYMRPSLLDVTLPFVWSYKPLSTSIGIVAGWALILLGLSYYLRNRIGSKRWATIHRFTLLAWGFGLLHALTEGTDAGQTWFLALVLVTAAPALVLLPARVAATRHRRRPSAPVKPAREPLRPARAGAARRSARPQSQPLRARG